MDQNQNGTQSQGSSSALQPKSERTIIDQVLTKIQQLVEVGDLVLPAKYSAENAIRSAMLTLSDMTIKVNGSDTPVLQGCSRDSIANSLMRMVTEGLSVAKHQGAFIAYAGKLSWQREYAGNVALARRVAKLKHIKANPIFEGDVLEYEINVDTGRRKLIKHDQKWQSIDIQKIKGGYAIYILEDGTSDMEVMTMQQIQAAWKMGSGGGTTKAHTSFTDQMVNKTVINRACKLLINTSDDGHLFSTEEDDDNADLAASTAVKEKVQSEGNVKTMSFNETPEAFVVSTTTNSEQPPADVTLNPGAAQVEECPI